MRYHHLARRFSSAARPAPFRVGIIGAGVGGATLASILHQSGANVQVHVWERKKADELPAGYNLLFNHNHIGSMEDANPDLAALVLNAGTPYKRWKNRTFEGEITMDCDVHGEGLTGDVEFGSILRWDIVCEKLRSACGDGIRYEAGVSHYSYTDGEIKVSVNGDDIPVDLLVVSDGRYSKQREVAVGATTVHTLDHVEGSGMANFRLVYENDGSLPEFTTHERLYNFPEVSRLQPGGEFAHLSAAAGASPGFEHACMRGHARLGIMPLRSRSGRIDRCALCTSCAIAAVLVVHPLSTCR